MQQQAAAVVTHPRPDASSRTRSLALASGVRSSMAATVSSSWAKFGGSGAAVRRGAQQPSAGLHGEVGRVRVCTHTHPHNRGGTSLPMKTRLLLHFSKETFKNIVNWSKISNVWVWVAHFNCAPFLVSTHHITNSAKCLLNKMTTDKVLQL